MPNFESSQRLDIPLLDKLLGDVQRCFVEDRTILSFREYFQLVLEAPERHLRSSAQYMVDMLHYFGHEERDLPYGKVNRFKLFDAPFAPKDRQVAGHEAVQEALYRILANFAREGRVNKLILLHGPNGSAKSSLCRTLMEGLEVYAHRPEGILYSYNWIFPSDRLSTQDTIGFGSQIRTAAGDSYAYVPAERIDARVPCEMHDHPLFLLPISVRTPLLEQLLPEPEAGLAAPEDALQQASASILEKPRTSISEYLRFGDLCYKCRRIYDALLASFDGDVYKVLNHIQIERFYLSKRYRRGIATIEPQLSVDARIQQVTADRSLAALPRALQHTSLYEPTGPLVDANRGFLEYSDLLKRPVDAFKYLLATVETATVAMDSFVLHLDMVYMASTNETYLDAFKEHPDFSSFKGRMELVKVPYLLRYQDERAIYVPHITRRVVGRHVAPHAMDVAALWATLTRMRRNDPALYPKDISDVIASLTPLEKVRLYDTAEIPERLTTRQAKELSHRLADIYQEGQGYPHYEGRFGASAREIRGALLNAAHHDHFICLHPLAVFQELRMLLASTGVYEFLKQDVVGPYHDHAAFLTQTEACYRTWAQEEVREAMGLTQEASYTDLFNRYVEHVSHWVKREKLRDPSSGQLMEADEGFMGDIEHVLMRSGERKEDFRRSVIGTIGARSLDNPSHRPNYAEIFKPYLHRLREDFYSKRVKILRKLNENFLKYTGGERSLLEAKDIEQAEKMLEALKTQYGYCFYCARDTVAYLMKKEDLKP